MRKIGIMGGTFNPIHVGHMMLAECARTQFELDEVWFIPTGCSYMKRNIEDGMPTPEERFEMTKLAISDNPYFQVNDIEIKREGNTYSYETLEALNKEFPEDQFYFIFGADCLFSIETWKEPARIFDACEIIASVRGDSDLTQMQDKIKDLEQKFHAQIYLLPFRNIEISSTSIREMVKADKSIRYLTPQVVIDYIHNKNFYK